MLITHIITGLNDGGAEAVLYRLCLNDKEGRHKVVSLMGKGKYGPLLESNGVEVVCLDMPQGKLTLKGIFILWRLLKKENPSVVQTWMYHSDLIGGLIARFVGVKKIFWNIRHSDLDLSHSSRTTIYVARVCAIISRFVPTAIVCCAQKAFDTHVALGYMKSKLKVIANGYDLGSLMQNDSSGVRLRQELGLPIDTPLLGMVARFDATKDHLNLIRALAVIKRKGFCFKVLLVGRSMDHENKIITSWLSEYHLGGDVLLLGQRNDIPAIMNALDLHVLSSCTEAFPNVVAEAMACGTPAVVTDVGDAAVIVGETGWVVPPRDHLALAEALILACEEMKNKESWLERKGTARQRVENNFSLPLMVASYKELWECN